jgi:hypothetical protein
MTSNGDKIYEYTTMFNSVLKRITKFACEKSLMFRTNKLNEKISMLISTSPFAIMDIAGPYLIKYADNIKAHDEKFFLTTDFTKDYDEDLSDEKVKTFSKLIKKTRKIYVKCSDMEKKYWNDLMDDLLIAYCSFLHYKNEHDL